MKSLLVRIKQAHQDSAFSASLAASSLLHVALLIAASILMSARSHVFQADSITIALFDVPVAEKQNTIEQQAKVATKSTPAPPRKIQTTSMPKPVPEPTLKDEQTTVPSAPKEEPVKATPPPQVAANAIISTVSRTEGGGTEGGGTTNVLGKAEISAALGNGISGSGGTALVGLGKGAGAPSVAAQTMIVGTNREAKPIQTARASYPPMALRMGVEGDVTLKIEVDTEGKVTKAEVLKSGGMGFDEEALNAVKRSRFEPAQSNGRTVPAEFTYVYRFRLAK